VEERAALAGGGPRRSESTTVDPALDAVLEKNDQGGAKPPHTPSNAYGQTERFAPRRIASSTSVPASIPLVGWPSLPKAQRGASIRAGLRFDTSIVVTARPLTSGPRGFCTACA